MAVSRRGSGGGGVAARVWGAAVSRRVRTAVRRRVRAVTGRRASAARGAGTSVVTGTIVSKSEKLHICTGLGFDGTAGTAAGMPGSWVFSAGWRDGETCARIYGQ